MNLKLCDPFVILLHFVLHIVIWGMFLMGTYVSRRWVGGFWGQSKGLAFLGSLCFILFLVYSDLYHFRSLVHGKLYSESMNR